MIPESVTSPPQLRGDEPLGGDDSWSTEVWAVLVGSLDSMLRSYYGIYEFTDDPGCLLRIGLSLAREPVTLMDGTAIEVGDPIGSLHFWNEHLPRYSVLGPELRWAAAGGRRIARSLAALAEHVEDDPSLRTVHAFRGYAVFSSRIGVLQLHRVIRRLGFEWVPGGSSAVRTLTGSITCYGLSRVHNPAALSRQQFFRRVHEIWISRATLLQLYGRTQPIFAASPGPARYFGKSGEQSRIAC